MTSPLTLLFGPWAPDVANNAVPVASAQATLPCADCQNVYFQDGNYQTLPGLNALGPAAPSQVLSAYSWYDQTDAEEIVFAGSSFGISEMVDQMWSDVPLSTGVTAVQSFGVTLQFSLSGQVKSTGIALGLTLGRSTAFERLLTATLVAGANVVVNGYVAGTIGSLTPSTDLFGHLVSVISNQLGVPGGSSVRINTANLGADYFTSLSVPALGVLLQSSDATYSSTAGASTWVFGTTIPFVTGNSYSVQMLR